MRKLRRLRERPVAVEHGRVHAQRERVARRQVDIADVAEVLHRADGADAEGMEMRGRLGEIGALRRERWRGNRGNHALPRGLLAKDAEVGLDLATVDRRRVEARERGVVHDARVLVHAPGDGRAISCGCEPCARGRVAAPVGFVPAEADEPGVALP